MNRKNVWACAILIIGLFQFANVKAQLYTADSWDKLYTLSKSDSLMRIERMAALEFHKLLNVYRKKDGADTIVWNETLWIASRNHCVWMAENDNLSHTQKTGSRQFSGAKPGDRYAYACGGKADYGWSGENALYNFSANGKTPEQIAKSIASASFEQWKNSPGHNANMLSREHGMHGTAFHIDKDQTVWGTDLFARCTQCPGAVKANPVAHNQTEPAPSEPVQVIATQTPTAKPTRFSTEKTKREISTYLYGMYAGDHTKKSGIKNSMDKAVMAHAAYLMNVKTPSSKQERGNRFFYAETPAKRVMKASTGMFLFTKNRKNLSESFAVIEIDISEFRLVETAIELQAALNRKQAEPEVYRYVSFGIEVKKRKDKVKIAVVRLMC